ncbi:hypothetical protein [Marinifilum caeruleilacunae]|uniref:Lipoprotein n=1 Tax=Marinifilum caeruleilacunae TaxID=2499076 RepID=A0ABX1WY59_9BACT|nr:hypothetical protein [Marinifilum caeruleilacunae]NOU61060.1 hypothetical protein [Marinifilum caeruleilacunae]
MKKIFLFLLGGTFLGCSLLSCDSNDNIIEEKVDTTTKFQPTNTFKLSNESILGSLKQKAASEIQLLYLEDEVSTKSIEDIVYFDFENTLVCEYSNTDAKALLTEGSGNSDLKYTLVHYVKEDEVSEESLLITQDFITDTEVITSIYSNSKLLFKLHVKGEDVISFTTYEELSNQSQTKGFWSGWGDCVGVAMDRMSSGTVYGSIEAMVCVAFGPSCAVGTSIGCAIKASL